MILNDTDHLWGIGGNAAWVWESFLRGLNPIFMDPYDGEVLGQPFDPQFEPIRRAMGQTLRYAERLDLAAMTPQEALASSGYCLAAPGRAYLVYLPEGGEVTVDLGDAEGAFSVEWFHPDTDKVEMGDPVRGGGSRTLRSPFDEGDAVLLLEATDERPPRPVAGPPGRGSRPRLRAGGHRRAAAPQPVDQGRRRPGRRRPQGRDHRRPGRPPGLVSQPRLAEAVVAEGGYAGVDGEAADLDGDGDLDLILGGVLWYENPRPEGDPAAGPWAAHRIGRHEAHDVEVGDLDGDGDLDIATRNQSLFGHRDGDRILLWRQETPDSWTRRGCRMPARRGPDRWATSTGTATSTC